MTEFWELPPAKHLNITVLNVVQSKDSVLIIMMNHYHYIFIDKYCMDNFRNGNFKPMLNIEIWLLCEIRLAIEHCLDAFDYLLQAKRLQLQLMIQNLGLDITISRILILLLTYVMKVNSTDLSLLSLNVKPLDPTINANTQYSWNFSFISAPLTSISQMTLKFPDCTILDSTNTKVFSESVTTAPLSITSQSQNIVTFSLLTPSKNQSYYFIVQGVKNCHYKFQFYDIYVKTNLSPTQLKKQGKFVKIQTGKITDMVLNFEGKTGDTSSILNIYFTAVNPVQENGVTFKITFPNYKYSDNVHIFDQDNAPNAQLTVNDVFIKSTTCALNTKMQCAFNNLQLQGNRKINLKLYPVTNPITANNYYEKTTDFQISIFDDTNKEYDITIKYEISQIDITEYKGEFAKTNKVNSNFLLTSLYIPSLPPKIQEKDHMAISFTSGQLTFEDCQTTNNFSLSRGQGSSITFQYLNIQGDHRNYIAKSQNTNIGQTYLYFDICYFRMPSTSQQINFQFLFSTTGEESQYSPYMKITATLLPDPGTLTSQEILLAPNLFTITQLASYTYSFQINEPLSNNSMFRLSLPQDIDLTDFKLDLEANCDILVEGSNVPTFRCYEDIKNVVIFQNEMLEGLPTGFQIQITLHNLRNPFHPIIYDEFQVETYYTWTDLQSLVEVGTKIQQIKYTPLVASLVVDPNSFQVNKLENIVIQYTPQIQISSNSVIRLVFNPNFIDVVVQGLSNIENELTSLGNNQWTFLIKETIAKSTVTPITFQATTPSKIGFHSCLALSLETNGNVYEVTDGEIQLIVDKLAKESFKVGSNKLKTGEQSEFTFQFEESVEHDNKFLLQIYFPEDISFVRENLACSSGCTDLKDRSTGGIGIIQAQITKTQTQKQTLTFRIKGIYNRRSVGSSGQFKIKALTLSKQEISESYNSVYVGNTNSITGSFVPTNDYYRGNIEPVQISLTFFNNLLETDNVEVDFTDQSYSINSEVSCIQATCFSFFDSTSKITTITIKPASIQVFTNPINFTIIGLISNQKTLYGEQRTVDVRSFTQKGQEIDEGSFIYQIGCNDIKEKNCKKCSDSKCTECYDNYNLLTSQGICTNNCGDNSKYETFDNSGVCEPCVSPCQTCDDATICRSCIDNHYFYKNGTCSPFCDTRNGYYISDTDCLRCQDNICLYCIGDIGDYCLVCDEKISKEGQCVDSCPERYIQISGTCYQCDKSCLTCSETIGNCTSCNHGYINVSGVCMSSCPPGSVNQITGQTSICTCTGDCQKCENETDFCLSCIDKTKYLHNSQCLNECPISTFPVGKSCANCEDGCKKCTQTTCLQCLDKLFIYENSCYTDCNSINETFINPINSLKCIQCPEGCDQCDETSLKCTKCIQDSTKKYILTQDKRCLMQCEIERTCDLQSQVDPIVPLPGTISLLIWGGIVAIIWIFFNKNVYVPYSLIFVGCLVQLFVLFYTVSQNNAKILKLETARLLEQSDLADNYLHISLFLLIGWVGLNYLGNIAHIFIFCCYTKKMIPNRQIHRITNYIVLIFASLTSFKFGLIAYSRMFPSPYLQIKRQRQLRPLHILTGLFIFGYDLVMVASGALLIAFSSSSPMTTTYLLGIDLILMSVFFIVVFIYILAVPKNDHYFKQIKKYEAEEHYKTQENLYETYMSKNNDLKIQYQQSTINKNKKQQQTSKANLLRQETNKKIFKLRDEDIQDIEQEENGELPTINPHEIKIIPKQPQQKIDSFSDRKTKRKAPNFDLEEHNYRPDQTIQNLDEGETDKHEIKTIEKSIDPIDKHKISSTVSYPEKVSSFRKKIRNPNKITNLDIQQPVSKTNQKVNHSQTSLDKMNKFGNMKKKNQISYGHSQTGDDKDIDEVDFQSIIQTKMIDRSLNIHKQAKRNKSERKLQKDNNIEHQEISPSWFNIENQRYDLDDADQN